jgi:hypothetical protein
LLAGADFGCQRYAAQDQHDQSEMKFPMQIASLNELFCLLHIPVAPSPLLRLA